MNRINFSSEPVSRKWKILSVLLVVLVVVSSGFYGYTYLDFKSQFLSLNSQLEENQHEIQNLQQQIKLLAYSNQSSYLSVSRVFDLVKDSVVLIKTRIMTSNGLQDYAQGSGFVYDMEGRIVTNHHVIEDADEIDVIFTSGNSTKATVIGDDVFSDIAVIKVSLPSETLYPVLLGNSSALVVGEPVVAVGNPYGLSDTVTSGIVSQVGRELSASGGYNIIDVIQLDAAINPGNSGGPLVNMMGQVVGINTAIVSGSTGVGFAIPSDTIKRELPSLLATGKYAHPWLGISGYDIDADIAKAIGLNYTYGVLIADVTSGGPAAKAGLKGGSKTATIGGDSYKTGGDVIIGLNRLKVRNFNDLSVYLERNTRPGVAIDLTIIRGDQKLVTHLTLGERPPP